MFPYGLIGKDVMVIDSKDPTLLGRSGIVLDETKNMLVLEERGRKMIAKGICTFSLNGRSIDGRDLNHRPEERIKRFIRGGKDGEYRHRG